MNFTQYWQLVVTKTLLNLKSEASKSYLSYSWWILEPALFVGVFYLVFGIFLANKTENFVIFLICGKIPFLWFSRSVTNAANSIVAGRGLMNQMVIPKIFFPSVIIAQDFVKSLAVITLMLAIVWWAGFPPHITWISIPVVVLAQLTFISAVAVIGAALVPFIPDIRFLITTGVMLMMFASGIFYSYKDVVLPEHQELFLLNPMANLIRIYRGIIMDNEWPPWHDLLMITLLSTLVLWLSARIIKRFDSIYPRLVIQ